MRNSCNEAPPHPPLNPNGCKTPNACWSGGGPESLNYFILIIYLIGCSNLLRVIFCYFFLLKKVTPRITPAAESLQLGSDRSARPGSDRDGSGSDRADWNGSVGSVGSARFGVVTIPRHFSFIFHINQSYSADHSSRGITPARLGLVGSDRLARPGSDRNGSGSDRTDWNGSVGSVGSARLGRVGRDRLGSVGSERITLSTPPAVTRGDQPQATHPVVLRSIRQFYRSLGLFQIEEKTFPPLLQRGEGFSSI